MLEIHTEITSLQLMLHQTKLEPDLPIFPAGDEFGLCGFYKKQLYALLVRIQAMRPEKRTHNKLEVLMTRTLISCKYHENRSDRGVAVHRWHADRH